MLLVDNVQRVAGGLSSGIVRTTEREMNQLLRFCSNNTTINIAVVQIIVIAVVAVVAVVVVVVVEAVVLVAVVLVAVVVKQ